MEVLRRGAGGVEGGYVEARRGGCVSEAGGGWVVVMEVARVGLRRPLAPVPYTDGRRPCSTISTLGEWNLAAHEWVGAPAVP